MRQTVPIFYDKFRCIASECSDSCCIGWEIDIDPKTYEFYNLVEGDFAERLKNEIDHGEEPHFILGNDERCPFLNKKNLCDIYINLGEEHLCDICTQHPRFHEWFGDYKESGLGLCCEEAARLLLSESEPLSFVSREIDEADDDCEFDELLLEFLIRCRQELFDILQDREIPLGSRLKNILNMAAYMQDAVDNEEYSRSEFKGSAMCIARSDNGLQDLQELLHFLQELESIDPTWPDRLAELEGRLPELMMERDGFRLMMADRQSEYEQLCVYFLYRYMLKAVRDGDLMSRVKLAVVSTLIIFIMGIEFYWKSGSFSLRDQVMQVKAYSKEMEYSQENLEAFLDASWEREELTTDGIIRMIDKMIG